MTLQHRFVPQVADSCREFQQRDQTGGYDLPKHGIAKEPTEWKGFGAALKALIDWSSDQRLQIAIVEGVAVSAYSQPRATKDIDAQVITDSTPVELLESLARFGFAPAFKESAALAEHNGVLPLLHTDTNTIVDIIFARFPFMQEMVSRAVHLKIGGLDVPLIRLHDLMALKLFAARPQDRVDVQTLLRANPDIDRESVLEAVHEYSDLIEEPELLDTARQLLVSRNDES